MFIYLTGQSAVVTTIAEEVGSFLYFKSSPCYKWLSTFKDIRHMLDGRNLHKNCTICWMLFFPPNFWSSWRRCSRYVPFDLFIDHKVERINLYEFLPKSFRSICLSKLGLKSSLISVSLVFLVISPLNMTLFLI